MAKYLERLVARAGIANDSAPAVPSPRPVYEPQAGDPFENTVWEAAAPAPQTTAPQALSPVAPAPESVAAPGPRVTELRTTELNVEEHWLPAEPLAPVAARPAAEPLETLREGVHEAVREVALQPAAERLEREVRTESARAETTFERETVRTETVGPSRVEQAPPGLDPGDVERNVLEKLMPALDAWFKSDRPAFREEPAPAVPLAPSPARDREAAAAPATEGPQLIIGSIRVEVASPPAAAGPAMTRRPAARRSTPASPPSRSSLSFGLGQM